MTARVLIVEDDPEITSVLVRGLALHGYEAVSEATVESALGRLTEPGYSAAIVDVMLGEGSGIELVRTARARGAVLPIVMLSALSDVDHRTAGLEAGADDYIVKPFTFEELTARLKVQQRRAASLRPPPARLDDRTKEIAAATGKTDLTDREYDLLCLLMENAGHPVTRGEIFDALWKGDGSGSENVVDVYLGYLRKKLREGGDFGFEIKTIRNKGFCLDGTPPTRVS